MATKYDTNPLDPDFPSRVAAEFETETKPLGDASADTRPFADPSTAGQAGYRFASQPISSQPPAYVAPSAIDPVTRKVEKFGLPENLLIAAPYIPWYIGMVASVIMLVMLPKSESKVRFHAAQGLAAHVAILAVTVMLGILGRITDVAEIGSFVFVIVTTIMLIVFAVKGWQGKPIHITSVEELTNWLEETISPKLIDKSTGE